MNKILDKKWGCSVQSGTGAGTHLSLFSRAALTKTAENRHKCLNYILNNAFREKGQSNVWVFPQSVPRWVEWVSGTKVPGNISPQHQEMGLGLHAQRLRGLRWEGIWGSVRSGTQFDSPFGQPHCGPCHLPLQALNPMLLQLLVFNTPWKEFWVRQE